MTEFEAAVRRLLGQVGHWEPGRWRKPADGAAGSRAEVVFALVQRLAERGADAEGRPRRPVPRLADPVLPDQLRVMADDLVAAGPRPEVLAQAAADVTETARRM